MSDFEKQLEANVLSLFSQYFLGLITIDEIKQSYDYINWKQNFSKSGRIKSKLRGSCEVEMLETSKDLLFVLVNKYLDDKIDIEPIKNQIVLKMGKKGSK